VLKISILPLKVPQNGDFQSHFYLEKIFQPEESFPFSDGLKFRARAIIAPCHNAIGCRPTYFYQRFSLEPLEASLFSFCFPHFFSGREFSLSPAGVERAL